MRSSLACDTAEGVLAACFLVATACGTGTDLNQLVNEPLGDGSASNGNDGGGASSQDPFAGAPAYASQTGQQTHNAGQSCIQSGCHGSGASGGTVPSFLVGGTVYADYKGTTPAVGVEVRIVDPAGHATSVYSGPSGTFFLSSGNASGVTFPAAVGARDATTTRPMITTLTSSMGSCGQTHCHVAGGGPLTSTGNYYPIHIP
jgi:hypothetical protein